VKKRDPELLINCPKCNRRLRFIEAFGTELDRVSLAYNCQEHGRWLIPPNRDIRPYP
jgi:hypothetical protein